MGGSRAAETDVEDTVIFSPRVLVCALMWYKPVIARTS